MITAIIPAAGSSRRMNSEINKQFMLIAGQPVLTRSLLSLEDFVGEILIISRAGEENMCRKAAQDLTLEWKIIPGGDTRQQSVLNGLRTATGEWVLIHDGNRPLASPSLIRRVVDAARQTGAAIPAVPVVDTIKEVSQGFVRSTLPRERLWAVQTPQVFQRTLLVNAYEFAEANNILATDDSSLVEAMGHRVAVVEGERENIKITTPDDLERAQTILGSNVIRVGQGYDVHQLVEGRPLILGGVIIPFEKGLLGHSDADVLIHVIMDSLLGAAALGDIGRHFPDTDPAWAGAHSCELLAHVANLLESQGFSPVNIDATVVAQRPRISPHIPEMIINIASRLKLKQSSINIKATTTESLGFAGRGEGIAAHCVCTVVGSNRRNLK
jgi:2-C-methyl-D-erythritol 4-phosphate cytidylyltransferase/2-C-methyl-D-erythritol 2,4-cyclodiphosphate synthase